MPYFPGDASTELLNWNPASQLLNVRLARADVSDGLAGSRCRILGFGDSKTAGVTTGVTSGTASTAGYRATTSYPARLTKHLTALGVPSQYDGFIACGNDPEADINRVTLVGGAVWSGAAACGGPLVQMSASGEGVTFTALAAATYNYVDVCFYDNSTSAMFTVAVDGSSTASGTVTGTGTGNMLTVSVPITAGSHQSINILTAAGSSSVFLQGASFWNSATPSVEVYNGGSGGATVVGMDSGSTGYGYLQGALAIKPQLVIIDGMTNDINNGTATAAQIVAAIQNIGAAFRAIDCDPLVVLTAPFVSANYTAGIAAVREALLPMCVQNDFALIDLSARYGGNPTTLQTEGFLASTLHPAPSIYDDYAFRYAALLATA